MGFLNSSFQVERKRNNHYYFVNSSSWHTFKYILQNRLCYFLLRKCFIPLSTFSRIYFNETFTRPASCFYCMHLVSTRCHCRACLHISEMQEEKLDFSTDSLMQGFGELYGNEFDHLPLGYLPALNWPFWMPCNYVEFSKPIFDNFPGKQENFLVAFNQGSLKNNRFGKEEKSMVREM